MNFLITYWQAGKTGYYYMRADNRQRAKEIFYYTHPSAQLMEIQEK